MRTILLEVSPLLNGVPVTLRLSGSASSSATTQLNGYQWLPCITKRHTRSANWAKDGVFSTIDTSWGTIEFWLNKDFNNEGWTAYEWSGAQARIFVGEEGKPFAAYTQQFEGNVSSLDRTGNKATIALLGAESNLTVPLLTQSYGGSGGADGMVSMKGTLKPRALGVCKTVAPVLVDGARYIYQVHGYGAVTSIPYVYEYAQALDSANFKGDAATYADLAALTLQPAGWATCLAQGMFRLGGAPRQKVTADVVVGNTDVASIARQMFAIAGVSTAKIGSLSQFASVNWCLYQTEQADILETLKTMFFQAGGYIFADGAGVWQVGDYYAPTTTIVLNEDRSTFPLVKSIKELNANGPIYKVNVGYDPCWDVHSESDVSPSLSAISDAQIANNAAVAAAAEAAQQAKDDAAVAKARTDAMVDDGKLDRAEKQQLVQMFTSESAQQTGLQNQTTLVNVTAERATLSTKFANLKTYLEGLLPSYTDTTQDTVIDRATFNARWSDYEIAKQALLNKIAGVASTVANYSGLVDDNGKKPADNATVGGTIGKDIKNADGTVYVPPSKDQLVDTVAPGIPSSLAITSKITSAGATLDFTWNAVSDSDLAGYTIAIKQAGGNYVEFNTGSNSYTRDALPRGTSFTAKVSAFDKAGNESAFSAEVTATTAKDDVPPGIPTALAIDTAYSTAFLTWQNPADPDLAQVTIRLYDANTNVIAVRYVAAVPGGVGSFTIPSLAKATTYKVNLQAFDTSGNGSTYSDTLTFTTAGGISVADFTPGLSPIPTVTSLPAAAGYTGPSVVFLQGNGKLYRYTNGNWTKNVESDDLNDGTITTHKLVDNSIITSKIAGGALNSSKLTAVNRPFTINGLNLRIDGDGVMRWDAATCYYTKSNNTQAARTIAAGAFGAGQGVVRLYYYIGDDGTNTNLDSRSYNALDLDNNDNYKRIAVWNGGTDLVVSEGVGIVWNGDRIVANTIQGKHIAASTITTANLLIADSLNYCENPDFAMGQVGNEYGNSVVESDAARAYRGTWHCRALGSGVLRNKALMKVNPGDQLYGYAYINQTGFDNTNGQSYVRFSGVDYNGTEKWTNVGQRVTGGTSNYGAGWYQKVEVTDTIPANLGVVAVRVEVVHYPGNGEVFIGMMGLMRRNGGNLIVEGAITAGKIAAGAIETDKLAANSINAGKLNIQTKPVSLAGVNMRWDRDNQIRWDAGSITYPDSTGAYITKPVVAGNMPWQGWDKPVNFCYNTNADANGTHVGWMYYSKDLPQFPEMLPVAIWNSPTSDFAVRAGVSTLVAGDRIVTDSLHASKIQSKSIGADQIAAGALTADLIRAGTITAAQIATGAIRADKLAVGITGQNMIANTGQDNTTSGWSWVEGNTDFPPTVAGYFASGRFALVTTKSSNGARAAYGYRALPVFPGKTYVWKFNATSQPVSRSYGFYARINYAQNKPDTDAVNVNNRSGLTDFLAGAPLNNGDNAYTFVWTCPANVWWASPAIYNWDSSENAIQLYWSQMEFYEQSDTTAIANGAITTDKITVNSLNGDRIQAGTLNADRLIAGSVLAGTISVGTQGTLNDIAQKAQNATPLTFTQYQGIYTINGNLATKTGGGDQWDYNAWVDSPQRGSFVLSGKFPNVSTFIGVRQGQGAVTYGAFEYAWHRSSNGNWYIFEGGNAIFADTKGGGVVFSDATVFRMEYAGNVINYWADAGLVRTVAVAPNLTFNAGFAIATPGCSLRFLNWSAGNDNSLVNTDPAARINQANTAIDPGKIRVGGGGTLRNWMMGDDSTLINGGAISANTVSANKLTIGNRGIGYIGLNFEWNPNNNWVYWSDGYIYYIDDNNNPSQNYISAGNTNGAPAHQFFYWNKGSGSIGFTQGQVNTNDSIQIGAWWGGSNLNITYGGTIINGDRITTNTVHANRIIAGTITSTQIQAGSISADKLNVTSLSAITANIGFLTSRVNGTGAGYEMDNNGYRLYASNNVLAVELTL